MNRFSKHKKDKSYLHRLLIPAFVFVGVVVIFVHSLGNMQSSNLRQQEEQLTNALNKGIMHTYATEGFYPPSLGFLLERYQISFNENLFYVDYRPTGANILPDLTIIVLQP